MEKKDVLEYVGKRVKLFLFNGDLFETTLIEDYFGDNTLTFIDKFDLKNSFEYKDIRGIKEVRLK